MDARKGTRQFPIHHKHHRTKWHSTLPHLIRCRKGVSFMILVVLYVYIELISPVSSRSINRRQYEDGPNFHDFVVTNSTGSLEFSHCLDNIKRKMDNALDPAGHSLYHYSDSTHDFRSSVNFTCSWKFNIKSKSSPDPVVEFKILYVDLPECSSEPPLTFFYSRSQSSNNNSASRHVTVISTNSKSLSAGHVFSARASSDLSVVYRHSTACPSRVRDGHGFHVTYQIIIPRHRTRLRRDAPSTQSDNPNSKASPQSSTTASSPPGSTVPEQPTNQQQASHAQQRDGTLAHAQESNIRATVNSLTPTTGQTDDGDESDSSGNGWKIAVGVIIPVIILSTVIIIAYRVYRKKFPVRMILGRQFSTFRNPHYQRPTVSGLALVREEPDWDQAANRLSTEYNPDYHTSDMKIPYHNKGFEDDEIDLNDESREERDFRMRKSWLFKKKEDQNEKQNASASSIGVGESSSEDQGDTVDGGRNKEKHADGGDNEYSDDSDIEAMLQEQKMTPRLKRKHTSESDLSSSSSSSEHITITTNSSHNDQHSTSSKTNKSDENIDDTGDGDGGDERKSSFVEKVEPLFQQQTIEEVRAELKARARSMSGSKCVKLDRPRSFSLQIDPSKSARRGSGTLMDPSSAAESDLRRFVQMQNVQQNVTASVVGVAYLSESVRAMYSSLSSVNSNPHLVTDLDEMSDESGSLGRSNRGGEVVGVEVEAGDEDGEKENRLGSTRAEFVHGDLPDSLDNKVIVDEQSDKSDEKRVLFQNQSSSEENSHVDAFESQSGNQNVSQEQCKDNSEDNDSGKAVESESRKDTSGSSSSSDTHVEDHPANMTKPNYTPQMSTVSALSDQGSVGFQESKEDEEHEKLGGLEETTVCHDVTPRETAAANDEANQNNRDIPDNQPSENLNEVGLNQNNTPIPVENQSGISIEHFVVGENAHRCEMESASTNNRDDKPGELNPHEDNKSVFSDGKMKDNVVESLGSLEVENESESMSVDSDIHDRSIESDGIVKQDTEKSEATDGVVVNKSIPSDANDSHAVSSDLNRDSGAQDLHGIDNEGGEGHASDRKSDCDEGDEDEEEDDDDDGNNTKKKIDVDYDDNNNNTSDNDDDDIDNKSSSNSDSDDSDTNSDSEDSSLDSGTDTKGSYSFQMSQHSSNNNSFSNERVEEEGRGGFYEEGETNLNTRGGSKVENDPPRVVSFVDSASNNETLGSSFVQESRKVRIISKLDLSDASSDSSDVLEDAPKSMGSSIDTNKKLGTAQNKNNNSPSLKKITFDLSNLNNDDDDSDDDDDDISDDGDDDSVVISDDDDDDDGDDDTNTYSISSSDQNTRVDTGANSNDNSATQHRENDSYDEMDREQDAPSLTYPTLDLSTRRESGGGFDVYNEFSDEAIDTILTGSDDDDVKNMADAMADSSKSEVTSQQRPIGVDPDVKFSFDLKTQVKVRVGTRDQDDIDV